MTSPRGPPSRRETFSENLRISPIHPSTNRRRSGCDGVDDLLGGGLRQGQVTELTGEAGTGKTQLCLSAAASAAALGHRVVYVDTGGCFSATRIKEFHRGFVTDDADSAEVEQHLNLTLDLITVLRVHDVMELFKVLEELGLGLAGDSGVPGDGGLEGERELADVGEQMGLLVVDSLSSLLSPVLTRMHHQGYTVMASVGALLRSSPRRITARCCTRITPSPEDTSSAAPCPSNPRLAFDGPAPRTDASSCPETRSGREGSATRR